MDTLKAVKPGKDGNDPYAITAQLELAAWWNVVEGFLREKLADIKERPRYRDYGYYDPASGKYVERGGIWNDQYGRAADGLTRKDVEDLRRKLRQVGLRLGFDQADALLNRYVRTGEFGEIAVTVETPTGRQRIVDLPVPSPSEVPLTFRRGHFEFERRSAGVYVARPLGHDSLSDVHVIVVSEVPHCLCGARCEAIEALADRAIGSVAEAVALADPLRAPVMREALSVAHTLGASGVPAGRRCGRPTDEIANALLLIARFIYGPRYSLAADVIALLRARVLPARHRNTLTNLKKRHDVRRALRGIYALTVEQARTGPALPTPPEDADTDLLVRLCVYALKLHMSMRSAETIALAA